LDLDHFKAVNDTHGHLVGSALLREVGELLFTSIRQVDSAFRYGGDEFAVLLVETPLGGAMELARRIHAGFQSRRFLAAEGLNLKLTASIGVASFPDHSQTAMGLLDAADRAMYEAKAAGRNTFRASRSWADFAGPRPPGSRSG
jgi:diguanylate cyclase (GGDEF)-like protein